MARTFRKEIRQPDALQTHGRKVVLWFVENQKILYVGLGAVVLVAAIFVGYRMWDERAREKASLAYGLAKIASLMATREKQRKPRSRRWRTIIHARARVFWRDCNSRTCCATENNTKERGRSMNLWRRAAFLPKPTRSWRSAESPRS